jgi:hypothetical protein
MTPKEVLIAARAKIEQGWCQGYKARSSEGLPINPQSRYATQWCMIGSLAAVCGDSTWTRYRGFLANALGSPGVEVADYNDDLCRTKEDVLAVFDKAIQLAEKI